MHSQLPPIAEHIRSLVPYQPGKPIEETKREYGLKRVIKLASNENPLGPSPKALAAVRRALKEQHRYPDGAAFELKRALSAKLNVQPNQLIVGNGSNEVIDFLVRAFTQPGDQILTHDAAFVAYEICAQTQGVQTLKVRNDAEMKPDLGKMLELVKSNSKIKLVFLANPNNPTGAYLRKPEITTFCKAVLDARQGEVLVVLDYAYWEYVRAQDLPDPMQLSNAFPHVVILRTFSKIYGLAGFRLGYGVMRSEVTQWCERVRQPFNVSAIAMEAGKTALADSAFVSRAKKANAQALNFWEMQLNHLEIPFVPSQGNFILAKVSQRFRKSGFEVFQECLRKGVIFRPVANYGLSDWLRISMGSPIENKIAAKILAGVKR